MAENWAKQLVLMKRLQHSETKFDGQRVGENIAFVYTRRKIDFTGKPMFLLRF